jgi:uncharacterized membrane protein YgcG
MAQNAPPAMPAAQPPAPAPAAPAAIPLVPAGQHPYSIELDPWFAGFDAVPGGVTAEDYLRHFTAKKQAHAWTDAAAVAHAMKGLRGEAADFYLKAVKGLAPGSFNATTATFAAWAADFRQRYCTNATAATTGMDFADLRQKPTENVAAFCTRTASAVQDFVDLMALPRIPADVTIFTEEERTAFQTAAQPMVDLLTPFSTAVAAAADLDDAPRLQGLQAALNAATTRSTTALDAYTVAVVQASIRAVRERVLNGVFRSLWLNTMKHGVTMVRFRDEVSKYLTDADRNVHTLMVDLRSKEITALNKRATPAAPPSGSVAQLSLDETTYYDPDAGYGESSAVSRGGHGRGRGRGGRGGRGRSGSSRGGAHGGGARGPRPPTCYWCGKTGHVQPACPDYQKAQSSYKASNAVEAAGAPLN